jgi:hypothetical protein
MDSCIEFFISCIVTDAAAHFFQNFCVREILDIRVLVAVDAIQVLMDRSRKPLEIDVKG